jgi:NAD(P)-dependent dehydrogenase (short-subunit alcohol dehydrogenase family)
VTPPAGGGVGDPTRPAYAASKAGVNALARHIALRWDKEGIRCNAVAPGLVMTEGVRAANDERLEKVLAVDRPQPAARPAERPREGGRLPLLRRRRMDQRSSLGR